MPSTTSRLSLPYPLGSDSPNVPNDIENLANALDSIVFKMESGTLASRPAAGHAGFLYLATDQAGADGNNGQWFYDTGSAWILINPPGSLSSSVTNSAVGDSAVVGTSTVSARQDHKHGRESFANSGGNWGSSADPARSDHLHGITIRQTHAYVIPGPITVESIAQGAPPSFYPGVGSGQSVNLAEIRYQLQAGTSVTFYVTHNGSDLGTPGAVTATGSVGTATVGASISDGDSVGLSITSASSDAAGLTISLYFDVTLTSAAS